jgi:hypothetical protein
MRILLTFSERLDLGLYQAAAGNRGLTAKSRTRSGE